MSKEHQEKIFEKFADLLNASELAGSSNDNASVTALDLVRYAIQDSSIRDLKIEKEIRQNPIARKIYGGSLHKHSMSNSPLAKAAADGPILERVLGPNKVEVIEDNDEYFLVVNLSEKDNIIPRFLEVRDPDGNGGKIELAKPIQDVIQIQLNMDDAQIKETVDILSHSQSSVYLLP